MGRWSRLCGVVLVVSIALIGTVTGCGSLFGPRWTEVAYWDIEYDLAPSRFELSGMPMRKGDGIYKLGPGRLRLQIEDGYAKGARVRISELELDQSFQMESIETRMQVELKGEALGTFDGVSRVEWSGPATAMRVEGVVICDLRIDWCRMGGLDKGDNPMDRLEDVQFGDLQFAYPEQVRTTIRMEWDVTEPGKRGRRIVHVRGRETSRRLVAP